MRIDIVSIFPTFFDVLDLSLIGKAQQRGSLNVQIHDLRDAAHDKHRTVDGTPAGGGAGMVMRPEPWGLVLGEIIDESQDPLIVFPSPAGDVFNQEMAHELAQEEHLVFGCGRYEGIDHRVFEFAAQRARIRFVSLGDYVLNGGEVATLAMIEAIVRLIPGVIGNPESLVEESHQDGLLEYPSYTQPASWNGLNVPEVLLSGNHAEIAKWRHQQQLERTKAVRPDLFAAFEERSENNR
jgi:tRNA (guanine37-N1)-methyltransferase